MSDEIAKQIEEMSKPSAPAQPAAPAPAAEAAPVAAAAQPATSTQAPPAPAAYYQAPAQPAAPQPAAPQPAVQPVQAAPAPLTKLSGGMKFGWFIVGALVGIPGILIAWLANVDKYPQVKTDAVKFAIIGFVIWALLWVLFCMGLLGLAAGLSASSGSATYSYGMYY